MEELQQKELYTQIIDLALREDIGEGDHSSLACITKGLTSSARILAKEEGILCGVQVACDVFHRYDSGLQVKRSKTDGDYLYQGEEILFVEGDPISILSTERTVLNFMQRMSGIATHTRSLVDLLEGMHTRLLDTRKTSPALRCFEKYAVRIGGAENHRFGLYDRIMLKDNHIDFAGGIKEAIERTTVYLEKLGRPLPVEIEVRNWEELEEVLQCGRVDRVMLDNFTPAELKEAVIRIGGNYETEASGGITKETLRSYAESGVDYISVGALTHQIKSLDMSMIAKL